MSDNTFNDLEIEIFDRTQKLRLRIVDEMTANGIPTDSKNLQNLCSVLDSIDNQQLRKKKLAVDSDQAKNSNDAKQIMLSFLEELNKSNARSTIPLTTQSSPVLTDNMGYSFTPDEKRVTLDNCDMATFQSTREE